MELEGEIVDIIYNNESNGYTVAVFETEDEQTTVVGYLPFISKGDSLKITGKFVEHKEYGIQFKVESFEKIMPKTLPALGRFLASSNIKGVGEATAKKIINRFGNDTLNIFKFEPEKLAEIKGISKDKAIEISESFNENWELWQIVSSLGKFGIGAENAKKVYDELGIDAIEKIEENPYILIDISRGIDFKQIDQMALESGIAYDNSKRIESGIKYALIQATYNGHSCVLEKNLIEYVVSILDVQSENIEDGLISLKAKGEIVLEDRDKETWVYLDNFYQTEKEIAVRIAMLDTAPNMKEIKNIDTELQIVEKNADIELSEKQKEAIRTINKNNVTIITGGPGTGKTTIIKTIIDIYEKRNKKVVLAAPTGRAAKKMTEATGKEASTLHRLLGIGKLDDDGVYIRHKEHKGEPIDADLIVVDEMSMVDMFLINYLLNCVFQGTKLILVGDVDQLASVGPGSVLKDLINSETISTVKLDKIFRQAAKSKIILNAHRVNNGLGFIKKEELEDDTNDDFFFIKQNNADKVLQEVISLSTGRLKNYGNYDFFDNIQVLTPTKRGPLGSRELNKQLQNVLNPNIDDSPEKTMGGAIYRVGDRIMQIKNNYDITWERKDKESKKTETGMGVFNGEMGTITKINEKQKAIEIKFDDQKVAWYEYNELDQIEHSYAITIHKAQRK